MEKIDVEKDEPDAEPENVPKVGWKYSLMMMLTFIMFELYRPRPEARMMQGKITVLILNGNQITRLVALIHH